MNKSIFLSACLALSAFAAESAIDFQVGATGTWVPEVQGPDLDLMAHYYQPIDQMVYLGLGAGYRPIADRVQVPLLVGFYMRLPMGRVLMPVLQAEAGYQLGWQSSQIWNLSLLGDLKLGDRSSLLFGPVLQGNDWTQADLRAGGRAGLLIEF